MKKKFIRFLFFLFVITSSSLLAESDSLFTGSTFSGLKFRSIGPAFMSGRIADVAIHPEDESVWYVAVGSGNVWKTTNAGTTWEPIFDDQGSYSIGCVTIDPNDPHTVWVGTGENVGGRHVGYGDGIYRSDDGGKSWKNMGLKNSEHISKIIVHPQNSDIVWVASQGPLWKKGGDRGLFKTTDGGKNWKRVLGDDEWTGVTDIVIDPRNPDRLYAATWQRHRNVAVYLGGGPGSGIYSSTDGGETWEKCKSGLPTGNIGKIGLAISPQNPDIVYAAIELNRRNGGVYKSTDRGASWALQSETVSGGTGPHYYQELYASPHQFDKIYLVDVRMQVSEDGGKTFKTMNEKYKHSDNHSIAFKQSDPDYLLVGSDGGLYETFDDAENWRYISNLPVTQFYKVAVDDSEPFYYVYGGTQDNNTQGGPSRTDNFHGIRNSDWFITLFGDGHQPATEPGNPDIIYSEWQQGNLVRVDRTTGEIVYIKPQPESNEYERFNWDSPILVSPHSPTRLYFASSRVWKSENRGDEWTAISPDLTKNQERIELPVMDKTWGWDAPWDLYAMSDYNTITSLAESPLQEGLIYAGTDDGLIQVTEDGGVNWRRIEVGSLPDCPPTAFVNDIKADLFDPNTVYAALDNHKFGDFSPYLYKSTDRGKSWRSISNNIPDRTLVWRVVQDHVKPGLMFAATEFGIYFTINGGGRWIKLTGGVPTISFRDLAIQRRENDLVGASFGRGFYILDDYSPLRYVSEEELNKEASLFPTRKAWWYKQRPVISYGEKGSQGASFFTAPNPPFGAVFTYYLKNGLETIKDKRSQKEKELTKENKNIPFPGWEEIEKERRQPEPVIWLTVKDIDGNVVRKITGPTEKGFHRVAWDLTYPDNTTIDIDNNPGFKGGSGVMAPPGKYTVTLSKQLDGVVTELAGPVEFTVERLYKGALEGSTPEVTVAFWKELVLFEKETTALSETLKNTAKRVEALQTALYRTTEAPGELNKELHDLRQTLYEIDEKLNGSRAKSEIGEGDIYSISGRLSAAQTGTYYTTYGPTPEHRKTLQIAKNEFDKIKKEMLAIVNTQLPQLEKKLIEAGAPWIEGQPLPGE